MAYVVLQHLFPDHPNPTRTSRPRKVVILLLERCTSSDGVYLLRRVLRVYRSYSPFHGGADPGVVLRMELLKSKRHIGQYYNMLFKRFYYINGSLLSHQELVLPEPSVLFGIDETTHPHRIRRRLEELPILVLVDDADNCSPLSDSSSE